jgi:pimeloyl-ACP methyl ester carboxylesterase
MPIVSIKGRKLFYEYSGDGPVILCIHPPGMGRKAFLMQKSLSRYMRVVFFDLSGHGDSTTHVSPSLDLFIEDIEAVKREMKTDQVFLFAYSAGCILAQKYTITYPNHVAGLILAGGYPKVDTKLLKWQHLIGIYMARKHPLVLAKLIAMSHLSDKELQQELFRHMSKSNPYVWRKFYEFSLYFSCTAELSKWRHPLLLLYGEKDDHTNHHVRWYQNLPNVEIHFIKNATHQLPTKYYRETNDLILSFLDRTPKTFFV